MRKLLCAMILLLPLFSLSCREGGEQPEPSALGAKRQQLMGRWADSGGVLRHNDTNGTPTKTVDNAPDGSFHEFDGKIYRVLLDGRLLNEQPYSVQERSGKFFLVFPKEEVLRELEVVRLDAEYLITDFRWGQSLGSCVTISYYKRVR